MKKLFILFLCLFVVDSFASGIASNSASAPCTNNTLETYSGNSNLSADWQPNEIQLRWYSGNTLMDVQESANTCVYDGNLSIPSNAPTRTGYTFAGWTVRPEMDFSTITTDENGLERWAIGWLNNAKYCMHSTDSDDGLGQLVNCDDDSTYNELQTNEWKVHFSHGDLYGMSGCSDTPGTWSNTGNPTIGTGLYCWCKATGYKPINTSVVKHPSSAISWMCNYGASYGSIQNCAQQCAPHCAYHIMNYKPIRNGLLKQSSN